MKNSIQTVSADNDAMNAILGAQDIQEDSLESLMAAELEEEALHDEENAAMQALEALEVEADQALEVEEDAVIDKLVLIQTKDVAYEEQAVTTKVDASFDPEKPNVIATPKKRTVSKTSTANMLKSDAIIHKLGASRYEVCVLCLSDAALDEAELHAKIDAFILSVNDFPKKVGEKVINMLTHAANGTGMSVYTKIAVTLLRDKESFTIEDLKNQYLDSGYSPGTASAQASQMMRLLPEMGLTNRSGRALTLSTDSVLIDII